VRDLGTYSKEPVDYPKIAQQVAQLVASGSARFGIMVDGAGIGSAMTANKVPGVLAAAAYNEALARNSREHNDANVLTLGAGQVDVDTAKRIVDVFLTTECTVDRHRKRVSMIRDLDKKGARNVNRNTGGDLSPEDMARIADRVRELLQGGGGAAPQSPAVALPPDKLVKLIDHTLLKADATAADVKKLCEEARKYCFASVCVNSTNVAKARALLDGSGVMVCAVVGFPLGAMTPTAKAFEAKEAVRAGADEIDMVINIGALKSRDYALVEDDIRKVVQAAKPARVKVILETGALNQEEKIIGITLSKIAGAHFVKTSTGFGPGGATVEDIALMRRLVGPDTGVKASGGVRTKEDAEKMRAAGANRIGASASVAIVTGTAKAPEKGAEKKKGAY